jgi:hypothetical protein
MINGCSFCDTKFEDEEIETDDGYGNLNKCDRCKENVCNDCEIIIWGDSECYTCGPHLRSCPNCDPFMQEAWERSVKEVGKLGAGDLALTRFRSQSVKVVIEIPSCSICGNVATSPGKLCSHLWPKNRAMTVLEQERWIRTLPQNLRLAGYLRHNSELTECLAELRLTKEDEAWTDEDDKKVEYLRDALDPWWYALSEEEKDFLLPLDLVHAALACGDDIEKKENAKE